jgi:L-aspartate oxidase
MKNEINTDCLIIGDGLAAHVCAYYCAKQNLSVTLISSQNKLPQANSDWAQGGIIFNQAVDIPDLVNDILNASANTANPETALWLATLGPKLVQDLLIDILHVEFNRNDQGELIYTKEGGHNKSRIIYSNDTTGHAIFSKIYEHVQTLPQIKFITNSYVVDLLTLSHNTEEHINRYHPSTCLGAFVFDKETKKVYPITAKYTVLATGGLGQIFKHTTNQKEVVGSGYAMAYRVGARIMDLEFIQFHPTVLFKKNYPRSLVSEAVRGEGAVLVNENGKEFMEGVHPLKSLAPRDIVARAIHNELARTQSECVYLDISPIGLEHFKERFPSIYKKCEEYGIDLSNSLIPVVPAAHYTCGGIFTTLDAKTSIRNLLAIGEVACTGLHGANRLASTSLLECLTTAFSAANTMTEPIKSLPSFNLKPWNHGSVKLDADSKYHVELRRASALTGSTRSS